MTVTAEMVEAATIEGYVVVTAEQAQDIEFLRAARKNEKGWKARKDELNAKIKDLLAGSKGAVTAEGEVVAELGERAGKRQVNLDLLASKYPDVYAEVVTRGKDQTVLNLK